MRGLWTLGFLTLLGLVWVFGAASAREETKKDDKSSSESVGKPVDYKSAATIDFAAAYTLPFDSLTTLGSRIEQARKTADPVGLATALVELTAAETVSGKTAPLSAAALKKEVVELTKQRNSSSELKAVGVILKDESLFELAKAAEKTEATDAKAFASGEKARGYRIIRVSNPHGWPHRVYVEGRYLGEVPPYSTGSFDVGFCHRDHVHLIVRGGHREYIETIHGPFSNYHYHLNR
jgi:hypothetical protein